MMNTSNLNESRISNMASNRDLLDMDLSKIREFIKLLEEHQTKCESGGRFVEAEMAKQRVNQFKKIENQKLLRELKQGQDNRKKQMEEEHKIELDTFNEDQDRKLFELNEKYEEDQKNMMDAHESEIAVKTEEFNREFPVEPKYSTEYLNLTKILEGLVKQKDYTKAHQVQSQMNEMAKMEKERWDKIRNEKLKKALEKTEAKQENEKNFFHKKMNLIFIEFKKNRAIESEKIIQKYKNRLKDELNTQKIETNEFHRPMKTAMKNVPFRPGSSLKNKTGGFN